MKTNLILLAALALLFANPGALRANESSLEMLRSTFKLFNKDSTATCFLLHDEKDPDKVYLVSAAHVFDNATGEESLLVLRDALDDGTYRRRDLPVRIRDGEKPLWVKHEKEDIAVVVLSRKEVKPKLPSLPLEVLATEDDLKNEKLTVTSQVLSYGFPARLEANGAGFPVARLGMIASFPLVPIDPHRTFMLDSSTFAGESGGPVFVERRKGKAKGRPMVLGAIIEQYRNDEKLKMLHENRLIRHRLSLGKVVHAEWVRETIASWEKKNGRKKKKGSEAEEDNRVSETEAERKERKKGEKEAE